MNNIKCINCGNTDLKVLTKKMPYVQHPVETTSCPECGQTFMTTEQMKVYRELAKFDGHECDDDNA